MSTIAPRRTVVVAALAALVLSGACGSSPAARFYTLSADEAAAAGAAPAGDSAVFLGPVQVPEYLDRPQIVTRTTRNELSLAEYDRWAGLLGEDVENVLAENLSVALRGPRVMVLRWNAAGQRSVPPLCLVGVDILRFEAGADGQVLLKAQWTIYGASMKAAFVGESNVKEACAEPGYAGIVAAMSRALVVLGRDITQALVSKGYAP